MMVYSGRSESCNMDGRVSSCGHADWYDNYTDYSKMNHFTLQLYIIYRGVRDVGYAQYVCTEVMHFVAPVSQKPSVYKHIHALW